MADKFIRHPNAHPEGGCTLKDENNTATNVAKDIIKKLGKKLGSGDFKGILSIPTPAYVHQDMSYLNAAKFEFGLLEKCLQKCKDEGILESPFQRLKHIVAAHIGAINQGVYSVGVRAPLNPVLGETLYMETEFGSKFYAEQTSHHPPISHFLMEGPEHLPFKLHGYIQVVLDIKGVFSSGIFSLPGIIRLNMPDGSLIELSTKTMEITGLLSDEKRYCMMDTMTVNDVTNGVNAEVIFDCNKEKRGGFFSFGGDKKDKNGVLVNRNDLIDIKLTDDSMTEIGRGCGSYLERVQFDGKDYWRVDDTTCLSKWSNPTGVMRLPSDSEMRPDLQLIRAEKWEEAEI